MSATISNRYLIARGSSAILRYLHVDLAVTGLVLFFMLAGGLASKLNLIGPIGKAIPNLSAAVEASSPDLDTGPPRQPLTPAMRGVLDHVAQRYRVSTEALQPVFEAAQLVCRERHLDPLLLIAVISIESRFNPFSQSPMGAQGLMQIIPRYHQDKVPKATGEQPFLDPVTNVQIGAQILQEAISRQGGLMQGLQYYAGAIDDAGQTYANKVLAEKLRLEQVARRKDGANA